MWSSRPATSGEPFVHEPIDKPRFARDHDMMNRIRNTIAMHRPALLLLLVMGLTACTRRAKDTWALTDIRGHLPDLQFALASGVEGPVTAAHFRGEIVLLYFGFLHCPDVCPMTMSRLGRVLKQLGDAARDIRIVFVSVDPKRDTPAMLETYAQAFSPQAIGVTGTPQQIEAMARRYRVAYQMAPTDDAEDYEVRHSKAVYVFDRQGRARLMITDTNDTEAITHDLRQLAADEPEFQR